jgi:hypothetical protein
MLWQRARSGVGLELSCAGTLPQKATVSDDVHGKDNQQEDLKIAPAKMGFKIASNSAAHLQSNSSDVIGY